MSIFLPYFFLPYIAFSDKRNINFKYDNYYLKNNDEVSKLENILLENPEYEEIEDSIFVPTPQPNDEINNEIFSSDNDYVIDEYIPDEVEIENIVDDSQISEEIIELQEDLTVDELTISNFEKYEKDLATSTSSEKNIETDVKDYTKTDDSTVAIAFGGEDRKEDIYEIEAKNDELKCDRCGSSLVGALNNICPGCGAPIKNNE